MKVVGKVVNALGPVGMIALSVLAPYAAPLWASFGAASAAAGGVFGSIGSAIYTAGNWVGATMGSMTSGISKGISQLAGGNFAAAGDAVSKGFVEAFNGTAGKSGVELGVKAAADSALKQAAGDSVWKQTTDKIMGDVGQTPTEYEKLNTKLNAEQSTIEQFDPLNPNAQPKPIRQSVGTFNTTAVDKKGVMAPTAPKSSGTSLLSKAGDMAKNLLAGQGGVQSTIGAPIASVGGSQLQTGDAFSRGGVGSGGGNFLSQTMLQAMQEQQQRMARGFS